MKITYKYFVFCTQLFLFNLIFTNMVYAESQLKVAAWNIANLHHQSGVELRPTIGTRRSNDDFNTLIKYTEQLNADIIALQEVGSIEAVHKLFPISQYEVYISGRYDEDVNNGIEPGIYTAIAVKKDQGINVIKQVDLDALDVSEDDDTRPTRWGTVVVLEVDGTEIWMMSVHLKSSCATTKAADRSTTSDCKTLWKQRIPLLNWVQDRVNNGEIFIIAGDFNRRFRQFNDEGPFWTAINNNNLENPLMVKHPESVTRKCPTRKGKSTQPIDWILLDSDISHWYKERSFWETRFKHSDVKRHGGKKSQRLSDHCPIHIELEF